MGWGGGGRPLQRNRCPGHRGAESRRPDSASGRLLQRGAGMAKDPGGAPRTWPPGPPSLSAPRLESSLEGRGGSAIGSAGRLPLRRQPSQNWSAECVRTMPSCYRAPSCQPRVTPSSRRLRSGGARVPPPPRAGASVSSRTSPLQRCSGDTPARTGRHSFSDTRAKCVRSRWWCWTISVLADSPGSGPCH